MHRPVEPSLADLLELRTVNYDVLRAARELDGRTQAQLAIAVDSHQSVISDLERGRGDPPVSLLLKLLDALDLYPAALFPAADLAATGSSDTGVPAPNLEPAYTVSARVDVAFLRYRHSTLGEIFQVLLEDLRHLRVDLLSITVHIFDRRPMAYAGAIAGRLGVSWRQHVITHPTLHLYTPRGDLYRGWRNGEQVRQDGEQCAMPDYDPAVVIDQPISQGMVGFGFARERPDISHWARAVSDAISEGLGLIDEIGQAGSSNLAEEVVDLKSRLDRLESRWDGEEQVAAGGS